MALVTINDTTLTSIADAIREKGGFEASMTPSQMATEIANLPTGGDATYPELYVDLSAYGAANKPSGRGALIIDTSNMTTLSFDCFLNQYTYSSGAYYSLYLTSVTSAYRVVNGNGTYIELPNSGDKLETLLDSTIPTSHIITSFSCDVSEYDKVCIYAYITPYSTSSSQNYSGYCKIYNIKGE